MRADISWLLHARNNEEGNEVDDAFKLFALFEVL